MLLFRIKGWRMMREKNKSTTPSLTFPFALFLNKTGNLAEKADMHFGGFGKSRHAKYGFQKVSQVLHDSFLASLTSMTCGRQLA